VIVLGRDRTLLLANDAARRILRVGTPDIGRPLQDLEVSYRPTELRTGLDVAFGERRVVVLGPVTHRHDSEDMIFEVRVAPLAGDGDVDAVSVTFVNVTAQRQAEQDVERAQRELGAAYEELQSTVEELETTNEELQSTNEELETTNEELQSTNEELETMNEELASSNEELETMNDELRVRSLELREGNAVMEAILRSKGIGVMVVDRDERVRMWTSESEELWGLREEEVLGMHLLDVDIGLPTERLRPVLRGATRDGGEAAAVELEAHDRRGREFRCAVTVVPLSLDGGSANAVVVLAERT
jgi:two-component system CheB/CheR fusion protein